MIVTITEIHSTPSHLDTVWLFRGRGKDECNVVVGVDHREAAWLVELLEAHGEIVSDVPEWAVLSLAPAREEAT